MQKLDSQTGRAYLTGIQALVQLLVAQRLRDAAAGLNTAGFVSGYRGSPLGGLDEALWDADAALKSHNVRFQPGVNEELAATAVWGTQQVELIGPAKYDGVFAMWYGKGPGVDRCGDVFKHMNHAGTARNGGVLLVAGDDHGAYSSTLPHQSDHIFSASMIPVLYPCNVQEYLDLGLHGWAMSRFSGCAVGFKALADTVESSASVDVDPFRVHIEVPADFPMPPEGLNARLSTDPLGLQARRQEALMQDFKIYAALAYSRANRLNRTVIHPPRARLGIIASGKSYLDVLEALEELGIDDREALRIGIRLYKVAMPWPLEPEGVREFASGLEEILVVEEKRQIVEYQLKEQLYNWREDVRPRVIGKFDERGEWVAPRGEWLLSCKGDLSVAQIAKVIAARVGRFHTSDLMTARLAFIEAKESVLRKAVSTPPRPAYYCSGCPHNSSTKVPEGSIALAGIGCHTMATAIYPQFNKTITQMGGEGAPWVGQAHFSELRHVFANLGDGTYFHSGHLALRAALAAGVNITYKILYNDAVAMTGGQPVDGALSVPMLARQVAAEGVERIALVTEDLAPYSTRQGLPELVTLHDRKELDAVQRELREFPGVSVLIYDQTCAAEKRRRRKRGTYPDPARRLFINAEVCEGCGDCGEQSNCTSIHPFATEFGVKRVIDQHSCNKDYSCAEGFCPSFVSVEGATLREPSPLPPTPGFALPDPQQPREDSQPFNILITGIGGTGVLTVGALLGRAAHLEGRTVSVLDMTGMSQKNGAVTSHVRIGAAGQGIRAARIPTAEADLVLGCDMLTAGAHDAISKMRPGKTEAVVNTESTPPGQAVRDPDWEFPATQVEALIDESIGKHADYLPATRLATTFLGDPIATNVFMLGYAFQKGFVPLKEASLLQAIDLNEASAESNRRAFLLGRRAGHDLGGLERLAAPAKVVQFQREEPLERLISRRAELLREYQDAAYAERYERVISAVQAAEAKAAGKAAFTRAVAVSLYRLMAYKDEYEVARLYTHEAFRRSLRETFAGSYKLKLHLAPPVLSRLQADGRPRKLEFGSWVLALFHVLARLKRLRGTPFDPFGYTKERKIERKLIGDYTSTIQRLLPRLNPRNHALFCELASLPQRIRGFGFVKLAAVERYERERSKLEAQLAPEASLHLDRAA